MRVLPGLLCSYLLLELTTDARPKGRAYQSLTNGARDEERRSFCRRVAGERGDPRADESSLAEQPLDLFLSESQPDVPHLLPILLAIVRQHVAEQDASARTQGPRGLA